MVLSPLQQERSLQVQDWLQFNTQKKKRKKTASLHKNFLAKHDNQPLFPTA